MTTSTRECVVAQLGVLPQFRGLTRAQLEGLGGQGQIEHREEGWVYRQGERAESLFVLLDGEVRVTTRVGADEIEVYRSDLPGACGGATQAHLGDPDRHVYTTSMQALRTCRLFVLPAATLAAVLRAWFPLMVHLQEQDPAHAVTRAAAQQEGDRLLTRAVLASSLTHELNNPAAAARAAAVALTNRVQRTRETLNRLADGEDSPDRLRALLALQKQASGRAVPAAALSGLELADRQDHLAGWLEEHRVRDGWDLAPTFVQVGLDTDFLAIVLETVGPAMANDAVRWVNYALETDLLLQEVGEATARISTLLASVKAYGEAGRDLQQLVDVHDLLDATLLMFRWRLTDEHVEVVRDYDRSAARVTGSAAELNQVWTNLIDNALDAIGGHGSLTIRTRGHVGQVTIEIVDDGPGIPEDIRAHVFEPFFSTKPIGDGTGIGLDVAARIVVGRHGGTIDVQSEPGRTSLVVSLPVRRAAGPQAPSATT
jgi:signal transduction histidine kinase